MQLSFRDHLQWILGKYAYTKKEKRYIREPTYAPHGEWYEATALGCDPVINSPLQQSSYRAYTPYEESFILSIPSGRFIDSSRFIIEPGENIILKHQAIDPIYASNEWGINELPINKEISLKGRVLLLNCTWAGEYYHFMASFIGRYLKFLSFNLSLDEIDYIVVPEQRNFITEWLDLLHLPKNKLIEMPARHIYGGNLVTCDELIIPSLPIFPNAETIALMRNTLLSDHRPRLADRKIYTSRVGSAKERGRHIINEEEIYEKVLKPYGFEFVVPENLSMREKAIIFNESKIVVSSFGSGMINYLFMQSGSIAVDICSEYVLHYHAIPISRQVGFNYHYYTNITTQDDSLFSNYTLEADHFKSAMASLVN